MTSATTLPQLLNRNAASFGGRAAFREKRGGIWQITSWTDHAALVARLAAGLAAHGFGRGDRLAVIGDNRPRLYAASLAAQSLGGACVPLSPDAEPDWIAPVLNHAGVSVVVAEDAEQVEKIVFIKDRLAALRLAVQTTSHGMRQAELDWLTSFDAIATKAGATKAGATKAGATAAAEQSVPGDPALLLYGDATRCVTLSHADLLAAADRLRAAEEIKPTDEGFAWLPMAWFADVLGSQALSLAVGFTCNCPETPETVWRDLREIGPTILIAPPRIWEAMLSDIEARAAQATRLKGTLFARFRAIAERAERHRVAGEAIPWSLQVKLALGEALIYAPMRDQIGLSRLRWANTGGETLMPRVLHGFRAFGINLKPSLGGAEPAIPTWEPAHA